MSTIRDALEGVKAILLLQSEVQNLEKEVSQQSAAIGELGDDIVGLDKRIVRIETMIEMTIGRGGPPQIKGN